MLIVEKLVESVENLCPVQEVNFCKVFASAAGDGESAGKTMSLYGAHQVRTFLMMSSTVSLMWRSRWMFSSMVFRL